MSTLNIRTLLSKSVTAIKTKLGIDSFTWGEYLEKLGEALTGEDEVSLDTFITNGTNADNVAKAGGQATEIRSYAFYSCSSLTTADFPVATSIGGYAFNHCTSLTTANFPAATTIGSSAFSGCSKLTALILRNTAKICTLSNTNAVANSAIASGTGYIYVPSALVDSYKAATNWSTYANQFRALEDYTVDGTTTGALDSSKV